MLPRNMSTNFFVNLGNVKVNTHLRLQQLDTLDITHPPDLCVITVANSFVKSMCWRHILMFTPKRGMHVPIQSVITFINHWQSRTGIARNIIHQGPHQNAVCVTGLLRKKNTWMNI